ncbi:hypothetical protein J4229_01215 [Candidatus Pacearchaeota archaeon]|nr:hypothetical protein [Candidatus Pacearchaeota archaeon]
MRDELILTPETLQKYVGGQIRIRLLDDWSNFFSGEIESIELSKRNLTIKYKPTLTSRNYKLTRTKSACQEYSFELDDNGIARICGDALCLHSVHERKTTLLLPSNSRLLGVAV